MNSKRQKAFSTYWLTFLDRIRVPDENDEDREIEKLERVSTLKRSYEKLYWLWITIIVFDLIVQALRSAEMSSGREKFISKTHNGESAIIAPN